MHIQSIFNEEDQEALLSIMQENAFATIITTDGDGLPTATPLPFLIKKDTGSIKLQAHFAKSNPQWKHLESNDLVLIIFNGPHCYISPSWYKNSGVPTWDYVSVHAYGNAKIIDNEKTVQLIEELSDKYEYAQEAPWKAAGNYSTKILNAIKGFEITVQKLKGKVKIGQNKSRDDLIGVLDALEKSPFEQEKAIAKLIKKHLDSKE